MHGLEIKWCPHRASKHIRYSLTLQPLVEEGLQMLGLRVLVKLELFANVQITDHAHLFGQSTMGDENGAIQAQHEIAL